MNTADLLIDHLYRHGVRDLFGMPGSHSTHLYDALLRHGGIRTILIRNEQAGAYAADGYARVTGRPGVICTTAGPGATNALSGIAEAYADSTPVLLLTGQVNASRLHQECGAYHELDLEGVLRPCTAFAATVMEPSQVPALVSRAFTAMTRRRPRPAALILPQDVMAQEAGSLLMHRAETGDDRTIPLREIRRACELLHEARRPLILAGGGAVWSGASAEITELAQRLNCPVVTTLNGKGIIDERNLFSLGHARGVRAMAAMPHADAMLAIGCRFTEVLTRFHTMPVPKKLVQIDIDPEQIGMNYPVTVGLSCDARQALQMILGQLPPPQSDPNDWGSLWDTARTTPHPKPEWLIETLRQALPDDAVVFTDACEMGLRMQADFPATAPRTFFYPSNYIALGWGFPAALGAAVALSNTSRVVVSVSGDGGFAMSMQELATAVRYRTRLIIIIHNDSAYGAIKNLQRTKHEARYLDTELNNPDWMVLAQAFGVPARRAATAPELNAAVQEAMQRDGPSLIEVPDTWRSLRI